MIDAYILSLINKTPDSLMSGIAQRVKQRRLKRDGRKICLQQRQGFSWPLTGVLRHLEKYLCVH